MSSQSGSDRAETLDLYDRSLRCWVDLAVASQIGPKLGIKPPQRTLDATEAWHKGAIEIGALLGKDEKTVKADAKKYFDPILSNVEQDQSKLSEVLGPVMQRAAECEAQFDTKH